METLKQGLEKIENPLRFSSGNAFRNLAIVRDLEVPLRKKIDDLREGIRQRVKHPGDAARLDELMEQMDDLFSGFEKASLDEKKRRVSEGLIRIETVKSLLAQWSEPGYQRPTESVKQDLRESLDAAIGKLTQQAQFVKGVGPKVGQLLARKGLNTIEDLLYFLPRKYEDRRFVKAISKSEVGKKETVIGEVVRAEIHPYKKRRVFEVVLKDDSGTLKAKWFKGSFAYLRNAFKPGLRAILTGDVRLYQFELEMIHPDFELLEEGEDSHLHFKRIVPIYSETEGLGQKHLRRILLHAVEDYARYVPGPIPRDVCERQGLIDIIEAVRSVHLP
ncbi:MAG TPA: OB-fold nucleic acid binding domain-containing protein, partial [Syntrophales bacterium]